MFPGESGVDQLVEIIKVMTLKLNCFKYFQPANYSDCNYVFLIHSKVLGTPTREEIKCMNPNYNEFKFPQIKAHPWHKVIPR